MSVDKVLRGVKSPASPGKVDPKLTGVSRGTSFGMGGSGGMDMTTTVQRGGSSKPGSGDMSKVATVKGGQ